jgi:hypothetical protein
LPEEVNVPGLTGEPEVPEQIAPPAEPEPQPETEEVIALRFKGEEHYVPKRLISELGQHLGADEYTSVMRSSPPRTTPSPSSDPSARSSDR